MTEDIIKSEILLRLKKAEGQIRGIQKMIENNRSCVDIIDQIYATRKAVNRIGVLFMKSHLTTTVSDVMRAGNKKEEIDGLMNSIYRFIN